MGARFRLTASALAVAAALCTGAAAGQVLGPLDQPDDPSPPTSSSGKGTQDDHERHRAPASATASAPAALAVGGSVPAAAEGLLATADGYTFSSDTTVLDGADGALFRFRITDPAGAVVHDYALTHERPLHLVLVARDLAVYHHLHPTLEADGSWTVALPALTPGAYRAFADLTVADGPALTLGLDLFVPGGALYSPLPAPTGRAMVHGYEVSLTGAPALDEGDGETGGGEVALTITSGGAPITDLQPYLGALGHLVAIRTSDLAFVHTHPVTAAPGDAAAPAAGPTVRFHVAVSAPGDYRIFFEFAHAGIVHTTPFTVHVPPPPP